MFRLVNEQPVGQVYGFKIHLSARWENYQELFSLVYPLLVEKGVCFKYIEDEKDVMFHFSEQESPAESGKYITIYPESRQHCLELLEELYHHIPKDFQGIYILSDRAYKDSQVIFYRFGFFEDNDDYIVNGVPTLEGPNGELWQDYQKPYFDLPSWVEDLQEPMTFKESDLLSRYEITACLRNGNGGSIYRACHRQSQQEVVIKEARAHIVSYDLIDKQSLRRHEFQLSQRLQGLSVIPQAVEHTREWINDYYIYEYVEGQDLAAVGDGLTLFAYNSDKPAANRQLFQEFLTLIQSLLTVVESFHKRQVVLNDIHANNFIVTPQGQLYFIDLENAYTDQESNLVGIYNEISLKEWNQLDGCLADCHKLGNLFLYLLGRLQVQSIADFEEGLVTDLLARYGIQTNFAEMVAYLFSEQATVSGALTILETIRVNPISVSYNLDTSFLNGHQFCIPVADILNKEHLQKYLLHSENERRLRTLIHREHNMGLDGLSGLLFLMHTGKVSATLQEEVMQRIQSHMIETEYGLSIVAGPGYASPYLADGAAGVIKSLMTMPSTATDAICQSLTDALLVEYAQHSDYKGGMLGVTDVLLDRYAQTGQEELLLAAEKQLINVSIKAHYQPSLRSEYIYVLSRYRSLKYEPFNAQQVV